MKPRVLFVTEKWPSNNPEFGLTNSYHNLFDSLDTTGLAETIAILHPDQWFQTHAEVATEELLTLVAEGIDVVVWTWLVSPSAPTDFFGPFNPSVRTFDRLKRINPNVKICAVWWDSAWTVSQQMIQVLYNVIDLHLTIDYSFESAPDKIMPLWTPQSPRLYYGDPRSERPVRVAHAGRLDNRPERVKALEELGKRGIEVTHAGGQKEDALSREAYAEQFRQSQIMLDFTPVLHKGRAWETTLCGALLVAAETSQINRWFVPKVHYITYKMNGDEPDYDDLAEQLHYFLALPGERIMVATNGHGLAHHKYTAHHWWTTVLTKLGWELEEETE